MTPSQVHSMKIPCHVTSSVTNVNTWSTMNVSYRPWSCRVIWKLSWKTHDFESPRFFFGFPTIYPKHSPFFSFLGYGIFSHSNSPSLYNLFANISSTLYEYVHSCQFDWTFFQLSPSGKTRLFSSPNVASNRTIFAVVDDGFSSSSSIL